MSDENSEPMRVKVECGDGDSVRVSVVTGKVVHWVEFEPEVALRHAELVKQRAEEQLAKRRAARAPKLRLVK